MGIKTIPQTYETTDGAEFDNIEDAASHQALIDARSDYLRVQKEYFEQLARTQKTADGVPFKTGFSHDYYRIYTSWAGIPELRTITVSRLDKLYIREDNSAILEVTNGKDSYEVNINRLYANRRNAEIALAEELKLYIGDAQKRIDQILK